VIRNPEKRKLRPSSAPPRLTARLGATQQRSTATSWTSSDSERPLSVLAWLCKQGSGAPVPKLQRRIDHVLRTALVKPAMNNAANVHASSRNTQPAAVSQAAVALAESVVRSQPARAALAPTGRLRSSPTLTC
jgi:hypothetical protein